MLSNQRLSGISTCTRQKEDGRVQKNHRSQLLPTLVIKTLAVLAINVRRCRITDPVESNGRHLFSFCVGRSTCTRSSMRGPAFPGHAASRKIDENALLWGAHHMAVCSLALFLQAFTCWTWPLWISPVPVPSLPTRSLPYLALSIN